MNSKPLVKLVNKFESLGADVSMDAMEVIVRIDLKRIDYHKVVRPLYYLLDRYAHQHSVTVEGVPRCLLVESSALVIYKENAGTRYDKNDKCQKCKYSHDCPGWIQTEENRQQPAEVSDLPYEIVLEVTRRCNLACPLCFSSKGKNEIPMDKVKTIIEECHRLGIKIIRFSGGEPLLYGGISEALEYAKGKGLYVILNTNATVLDKKLLDLITRNVDNILVSFQGFNAETEGRLTQRPGNFKQKIHNLVELNSRIPVVRIGTIITHTLIDNLSKYYYLIDQLRIKHWELYRPMLFSQMEEFDVKREDMIGFLGHLRKIKLRGYNLTIANPVPFCITDDQKMNRYVCAGARSDDGHSRLVFDTEQFFKPSYFIGENLGEGIEESWKNPLLTKMRSLDYLPKGCKMCRYLNVCKGGSRQMAKVAHGDYFTRDPWMCDD